MSSLDRILPFLRPVEDLLVDPTITEVMVNAGGRRIFVERQGSVEAVPDRTLDIRMAFSTKTLDFVSYEL